MPTAHPAAHQHEVKPAAQPLWRVTGQSFATRYVVGMDPINEWTVYFQTRDGVNGQVTIPANEYAPDTVAAAIEPMAKNLEAIHKLEGAP